MSIGLLDRAPISSTHLTKLGGGVTGQFLTTTDIAAELGVKPITVSQWRSLSRPGKRYAANPFPEPDHVLFGRVAAWRPDQMQAIRDWNSRRVGRGVGGGSPSHKGS